MMVGDDGKIAVLGCHVELIGRGAQNLSAEVNVAE
jgi:hypothetical protein